MTTPQSGPAYQGRALPRPGEELVDQGLGFDIGTVLTRRRLVGLLGGTVGSLVLAGCSNPGTADGTASSGTSAGLIEIPDETAGPYPGDGSNGPDALTQSGIVRKDLRSSIGTGSATAAGIPLTFTFTVLDLAKDAAPFAGVAVYAWHCDRDGNYSLYSSGLENENYLRGVQIADGEGKVSFTSIVPACYSGRWPHIHFEIYPDRKSITDASTAISTSQLAFPKDVCDAVYATSGYEASVDKLAQLTLATDNVFGDDGGVHQLAAVTGSVSAGYTATLTVPVDTRTEPTGGNAPMGGGNPPPGGDR